MVLKRIIEKLANIATEINGYEDTETNIILKRNDDGTYMEVKSDDDNN